MTEVDVAGKRVSWAELFFGLVFVFAITQLTAVVHEDHGWSGVGAAVVLALLSLAWALPAPGAVLLLAAAVVAHDVVELFRARRASSA